MRIRFCLGLAALGAMLVTFNIGAQEKKEKTVYVQGTVQAINKSTSMIMVKDANTTRQVMFAGTTKFLYGHSKDNKPGSSDKVQEGNFINRAGAMEGGHLMAKECVYREAK